MYNKTQCDTFVLSEIFGSQYFVADVYSYHGNLKNGMQVSMAILVTLCVKFSAISRLSVKILSQFLDFPR